MGLLLVPTFVCKILLIFVYTCYFVVVAVVVGAVCVGACIDVASWLVLADTVVGPWSPMPVALSVFIVHTLDLKMWWPQGRISGPALFVGMPQFLAPAACWSGACCS
jgi:hypothetical protein